MRAELSHRPEETILGPFEVATGPAEIAAFAAATGAPATDVRATTSFRRPTRSSGCRRPS